MVGLSSRLQALFIDTSLTLITEPICTISDIDQPGKLTPRGPCQAVVKRLEIPKSCETTRDTVFSKVMRSLANCFSLIAIKDNHEQEKFTPNKDERVRKNNLVSWYS